MMISVTIQTEPFDTAKEEAKLQTAASDAGALVMFKGMVRGKDQQQELSHLYLEHYPQVTEQEIQRIIQQAVTRWQIADCIVIHRIGELAVGDSIVLVIVTAKHRKEAFHAAEFIMDYLKTEAPFWKKEYFKDGVSKWVEAKESDNKHKQRWS